VSKDDFPVFKLFKKGADVDKPIEYTDEKTEEGLATFLKSEVGLYIGLPGNVEAFDKLAGGFLALDKGKQEERLADAEAAQKNAAEEEAEYVKFYVKTMKKVRLVHLYSPLCLTFCVLDLGEGCGSHRHRDHETKQAHWGQTLREEKEDVPAQAAHPPLLHEGRTLSTCMGDNIECQNADNKQHAFQ
jgi:hypothetical protein